MAAPFTARLLPPETRRQPEFSLATVNIVLLLVLFFLVAGTIVDEEEAALALPETVDLPLDDLPRPLLLLRRDGGHALDGVEMELPAIIATLAERQAGAVYLLAPADLPALRVLQLVADLAPLGAEVSLVTLRNTARRPGGEEGDGT